MSKLAAKTIEWLKEAEQKYIDGIPAVTDENRKRLMQIGLDAVRDELQRRAQKKSVEPSENKGLLEQQKTRLRPELNPSLGIPALNETPEKLAADRVFNQNPILTAPQPKALTKIPAPTKPIKWANGKVYEMNELDLRRKSVDYFSDVLNGKREPKDFYRSMQFNNLVRFQIGLYRFGNEVMEHKALHPTLEMCKKETQERSEELYRQVVEYWKQYKDTDIV